MTIGDLYTLFWQCRFCIIYQKIKVKSLLLQNWDWESLFCERLCRSGEKSSGKFSTRVILVLREIDLKSKGLGAGKYGGESELLKEMVYLQPL